MVSKYFWYVILICFTTGFRNFWSFKTKHLENDIDDELKFDSMNDLASFWDSVMALSPLISIWSSSNNLFKKIDSTLRLIKVIIHESRGEQLLWNRNEDFELVLGLLWAGWQWTFIEVVFLIFSGAFF